MIDSSTYEVNSKGLPDFVLKRTLSKGKFQVILAGCLEDQTKLVFKIFSKDQTSYHSFATENHIHSFLSHPNIIQYISSFEFPLANTKYPAIVMEYAPYGDFFDLSLKYNLKDEKLIRTFFHHLIEGLEYLHSCNIAHLDLKLENLLLGEDLLLKIADFDLAQEVSANTQSMTISRGGTANYRGPEIISEECSDYCAADVYSAGICLYTLMAGAFPFMEECEEEGVKLFRYDTFMQENEEFWNQNEVLMETEEIGGYFSESLRELLNKMWVKNPSERITIQEIKKSKWYNQPIYYGDQLKCEIERRLGI